MYHYDPVIALEELNEDATLPNPVKLRDMMLRAHLDAGHSLEYNRLFVDYQKRFGELQELGRKLLEEIGGHEKLAFRTWHLALSGVPHGQMLIAKC